MKRKSAANRFWEKTKADPETGCIIWTAYVNNWGYGTFRRGSASEGKVHAHRFAWELEHGPIPEGLVIDHLCHNPACVNVQHLRTTDQQGNRENKGVLNRNNTSGYRGVSYHKRMGKYQAYVKTGGKVIHLGVFETAGEAAKVAEAKRAELYAVPGISGGQ